MATVPHDKKGKEPVRLLSTNSNPNEALTKVSWKQNDREMKEIPCLVPVLNEGCLQIYQSSFTFSFSQLFSAE